MDRAVTLGPEHGTYGHEISLERGLEARELRKSNGLTRPRLADLINRSERSIFRCETEGITEARLGDSRRLLSLERRRPPEESLEGSGTEVAPPQMSQHNEYHGHDGADQKTFQQCVWFRPDEPGQHEQMGHVNG